MTWPPGRYPDGDPRPLPGGRAVLNAPVPAGRGRWRFTLHNRAFAPGGINAWQSTIIAELTAARGRRLETAWNSPAALTFTIDGHHAQAQLVKELATDVMAWRWDERYGGDRALFKGLVTQSEDQLSEQSHSVTFTCHDYVALLERRLLTSTLTLNGVDQDNMADTLITTASTARSSSGVTLAPGAYIPLQCVNINPDGSTRSTASGQLRNRTWYPQTNIGEAFADLARVINGFDYAVDAQLDALYIYYPYQGVVRSDVELVYGSSVAALTRSVNSADYANYWRVLGNASSTDPNVQLYSEAWNADANNVTAMPVGLWMGDDNAADVTVQATLADKANGDLALAGQLTPTYSVTMRPGWYYWQYPNLGDTVPLVVKAGRLNVNTAVRVLGIGYDIGDDGDEDVTLTVGRPALTLADLLRRADTDINALTRR